MLAAFPPPSLPESSGQGPHRRWYSPRQSSIAGYTHPKTQRVLCLPDKNYLPSPSTTRSGSQYRSSYSLSYLSFHRTQIMKPREKASSGLHNEHTVLCYAVRGAHQGFIQEYEKTLRVVLDAPGLDTMGLEPPSPISDQVQWLCLSNFSRLEMLAAFQEKTNRGPRSITSNPG